MYPGWAKLSHRSTATSIRQGTILTGNTAELLEYFRGARDSRHGGKGVRQDNSCIGNDNRCSAWSLDLRCSRLPLQSKRLGAVSSVVERLVYTERVGGSNPSPPSLAFSIFEFASCDSELTRAFERRLLRHGSLLCREMGCRYGSDREELAVTLFRRESLRRCRSLFSSDRQWLSKPARVSARNFPGTNSFMYLS